jgi:hypothetical protein
MVAQVPLHHAVSVQFIVVQVAGITTNSARLAIIDMQHVLLTPSAGPMGRANFEPPLILSVEGSSSGPYFADLDKVRIESRLTKTRACTLNISD